ncbi:MAG: ATP-binding protein [Desulfatibacillaceae bacterium]
MPVRKIIEIDEERCDGCGQCILSCAEGALELVDGKAKLVGEIYCDGIGACLGECPQDALTLVEREVEEFDEAAVHERLQGLKENPQDEIPCGCPSSSAVELKPRAVASEGGQQTALGHFPVKLRLLQPGAPFLKDSDLVLLADCSAVAYANLHADLLPGRAVALACPKFEDADATIDHLAGILAQARPKSVTVAYMEVPCCKGLVYVAQKAVEQAGLDKPLRLLEVTRNGELREHGPAGASAAAQDLAVG